MTISPCAMLITPMVPKVMASPIAASSSTEPSEMPYQTFCAASQAASDWRTEAAAVVAAALISGSDALLIAACRTLSASRLPRSRTTSSASSFCCLGASETSTMAARASWKAVLMRGSFSAAIAASRAPSAAGSGRLNSDSAASRRTRASGLIRVSEPTAASMRPRSRLLTRTRSSSASVPRAGRLAGDRLGERELVAVGLADDHDVVGLADIELACRQRLEDGRGARFAGGDQLADRLLALAEAAGGEVGHEGRKIGSPGRRGDHHRGQRRRHPR